MSTWTHVDGSVKLRKDCGFSVVKSLKEYFEDNEAIIKVSNTPSVDTGYIICKFVFSYSLENEAAFKLWKNFADNLATSVLEKDANSYLDAVVSVRYLG